MSLTFKQYINVVALSESASDEARDAVIFNLLDEEAKELLVELFGKSSSVEMAKARAKIREIEHLKAAGKKLPPALEKEYQNLIKIHGSQAAAERNFAKAKAAISSPAVVKKPTQTSAFDRESRRGSAAYNKAAEREYLAQFATD